MSIWLHAAAGGLQGLGTSIMTADAEKRENRGLALREKYLSARQAKQRTYRSGENELTRAHRAEENALTREHQTELSQSQIAAANTRTVEGRAHDVTMEEIRGSNTMTRLEAQLSAAASEGDKNRRADMERTRASISAGLQKAIADGSQAQYKDQLEETLKRAGTDPDVFDAAGDPVTNWALYDEMLTLTAKAEGVPPWRQPVQTADMIGEYASLPRFGGDVDATVTWLKQRHYRVPEPAIAQARRLATSSAGDEKPKRTSRHR